MFERFTDRARRAVALAQEEAKRLDHNYIGTEHILLGLIHEGDGVAAQVLVGLGVDLDRTRQLVTQILTGRHREEATSAVAEDIRDQLAVMATRLTAIERALRDTAAQG